MNSPTFILSLRPIFSFVLVSIIHISAFAQDDKQPDQLFMKSKDGVIYIDNIAGSYFTIDIPGDSLKGGGDGIFLVDDEFYQVIKNKYDPQRYQNRMDTLKAIELLKYGMKYEVDYLSEEVFKKELKTDFEIFKNSDGKRFLLWYYETPEIKTDSAPEVVSEVKYHCYLTFIANQHSVGLYYPLSKNQGLEKGIEDLKKIADRVDVYGYRVDLDGLHFKLEMQKEDASFVFGDSSLGFEVEVPNWMNLTENQSSQYWMGTMPDINNVKNAVMIQWHDKKDFKSFKKFNNEKLVKLKMGDRMGNVVFMLKKELEMPENINGVAYKVNQMFNKVIYHAQYLTAETPEKYLLIVFTATPETYGVNLAKFEEFISGIKIMD